MYVRFLPMLLFLVGFTPQRQATTPLQPPPDVSGLMQGMQATQDQASAAEKVLAGSPDDLKAHFELIGYYFYHDRSQWAKHLFWVVDHHPESPALLPLPPVILVGNNQWSPSPDLIEKYSEHWKQAVAVHPREAAVLYHAAIAFSDIDESFALSFAKRSVALDSTCLICRQSLGGMYGLAMLRMSSGTDGKLHCLSGNSESDQVVASLRRDVESLSDAEVLVGAGLTMKGFSQYQEQHCGGNAAEDVQFGMKLVRKGVGLDPSIIDREKLQRMLNDAP